LLFNDKPFNHNRYVPEAELIQYWLDLPGFKNLAGLIELIAL